MDGEELEIVIARDGKVMVRTLGIKGPKCVDIAEAVARIIGREESRQLTDEYYEAEIQSHVGTHEEQRVRFEFD
jgi:hypothetical protein